MSRLRNRHRRHSLRVLDRSPSSPPSWSTPNGRCLARTTAAVEGGGGHPSRATSPGAVAFVGGALSAVLLPARVEALPVDAACAAPAHAHLVGGRTHGASNAIVAAVMPWSPCRWRADTAVSCLLVRSARRSLSACPQFLVDMMVLCCGVGGTSGAIPQLFLCLCRTKIIAKLDTKH